MKSFAHLNNLVDIIAANNLPLEQIIWVSKKEKTDLDIFFKNLIGSSGIAQPVYKTTGIKCDIVSYRGYTFYIIEE